MLKYAVISLLTLLTIAGCSIHRIEVQQGNVLDEAIIRQIKTGMNKTQVKFLLGEPAIRDIFHKNRWDYVYRLKPGDRSLATEHHIVTLTFSGDTLSQIETTFAGE